MQFYRWQTMEQENLRRELAYLFRLISEVVYQYTPKPKDQIK